jgi:hypothetical protein
MHAVLKTSNLMKSDTSQEKTPPTGLQIKIKLIKSN